MVNHNAEQHESNLGNGKNNFADLDGGSILVGSTLSDINSTRQSGSTHLHNMDFSDSGFGIQGMRDIKSGNEQSKDININFDNIPVKEHTSALERWPFKSGHEETLHDKISDRVKEGMDPKERTELDKEEKAFDKSFKSWSTMAGIGIKPPSLDNYPVLKQHLQKVADIEHGITRGVMDGLTPSEKSKLEHESDPLGSGFAPRPMGDEVVKRVREATKKYLESTNKVANR